MIVIPEGLAIAWTKRRSTTRFKGPACIRTNGTTSGVDGDALETVFIPISLAREAG